VNHGALCGYYPLGWLARVHERPVTIPGPRQEQIMGKIVTFTAALAGALGNLAMGAGVLAQTPPPHVVGGEVAAPVEITMGVSGNQVQCGPRRARLPAQQPLDLRVINGSETPLMFVAPKFFNASQHIQSAGFVMDLVKGGFLVAPKSTVTVLLHTPDPGEYYFSCYRPDSIPNRDSSGFLTVVPGAS